MKPVHPFREAKWEVIVVEGVSRDKALHGRDQKFEAKPIFTRGMREAKRS